MTHARLDGRRPRAAAAVAVDGVVVIPVSARGPKQRVAIRVCSTSSNRRLFIRQDRGGAEGGAVGREKVGGK